MSTLFSRQCEYALQAVLYLALKKNEGMISIKKLATTLNVPHHFLAKILQRLAHQGLLRSHKGAAGGFTLAIPPEHIPLLRIVESIDGKDFLDNCVLGFPDCSSTSPCSLHEQWSNSRDTIIGVLHNKTVDQMASSMRKDQYMPEQVNSRKLTAASRATPLR